MLVYRCGSARLVCQPSGAYQLFCNGRLLHMGSANGPVGGDEAEEILQQQREQIRAAGGELGPTLWVSSE